MDRRTFSKLVLMGALSLGAGSTALLSGCNSTIADTTKLKNKSVKAEDDKSGLADEPTVTLRLAATEAFTLALPALQECYQKTHGNVIFEEPAFASSADLLELIKDPSFDGFISDLDSVMTGAYEAGLTNETLRYNLYASRVSIIRSPDVAISIKDVADVADNSIERIVVGNVGTVYSGVFANQALSSSGLYMAESGINGAYADSIAERVEVVDSMRDIVNAVQTGSNTIGFVLGNEALVTGANVAFEVLRNKYRTVMYRSAGLSAGKNMIFAIDFLRYCATETEAEKIADVYGMPVS